MIKLPVIIKWRIAIAFLGFGWLPFFLITNEEWIREKHKGYNFFYTEPDRFNISEYGKLVRNGMQSVKKFFHSSFRESFDIYVHPDRHSLDSSWQKDWKMPEFRSECWMVASGVAKRMDMISPKNWDKQACEHRYAETEKTQRLITHELVHDIHEQVRG